jgi:hypothetical protein
VGEQGLSGVRLTAELTNDAASGLGLPLPPGPVRLYAPDRTGRLDLLATQPLPAVAIDQPLSFDLGPADDVDVKVDTITPAPNAVRRVVKVQNLRTEDLIVRLIERRKGKWSVTASSTGFTPPADGAAWAELTVPANGAGEVRYQLQVQPPAAAPAAAAGGAAR